MKVIIAGGRGFTDYDLLIKECDRVLNKEIDAFTKVEIVEGGASGADKLGRHYANRNALDCTTFEADWNKYKKSAGPIRNRQMAEYADILIAFWDGESRGTKNMIDEAKKRNLKVHIINYERNI